LEVCVPWHLDEGSKDNQSRIIEMILDGSVEQHNTLFGVVLWSNTRSVVVKENFTSLDVKF
jgi:hypothetical protein